MAKTVAKKPMAKSKAAHIQENVPSKKSKAKKSNGEYRGLHRYIYRVLKQIDSKTAISQRSMAIMSSFVNDIFMRLAIESNHLIIAHGNRTMKAGDVQAAARLVLPGELAKNAIYEGLKAVTKYNAVKQ